MAGFGLRSKAGMRFKVKHHDGLEVEIEAYNPIRAAGKAVQKRFLAELELDTSGLNYDGARYFTAVTTREGDVRVYATTALAVQGSKEWRFATKRLRE